MSVPPSTTKTAVLFTEEQASNVNQHISILQQAETEIVRVKCEDMHTFIRAKITQYGRIDLLVDEAMCNILMEDGRLYGDVHAVFKELDRRGKHIYVCNKCSSEDNLFDDLYHQIPKRARIRFEDRQSKQDYTFGNMSRGSINTSGMTGGTATGSSVAGTVGGNVHVGDVHNYQSDTYETSKTGSIRTFGKRRSTTEYDTDKVSNKVRISIDCAEKESSFYLTLTENKYHLKTQGVKGVEITTGSIIISLTIEDGFTITEEWVQALLRTIFDDILGTCIAEGETFLVDVERQVTTTEGLHTDQSLHENWVARQEHSVQTESLQKRVKELEKQVKDLQKEMETIMEEDLKEAKLMLYMKHSSTHVVRAKDTDVSSDSGFSLSTSASKVEDEHEAQKEEILPAEPSMCEVHDGSATLIYFNRNNMLHEACRKGQLQIVRSLLSAGRVDINSRGEEGVTPVLIAAWNGYRQVVDLLVESGCDLSAQLDNGNNILHVACFGGNVEIVDYIVTNRVVDIDSRGMYGRTAVMKAADKGQKKVFDLLVSRGCELSVVDDEGDNILHVACMGDSVEVVDFLITHQLFDIEKRGKYGRTPVMYAANKGQKKVFDLLVSRGCDMSVVDDEGHNILHVACLGGSVEVVGFLVTHKLFDIERRDKNGWTPVMCAASEGQKKVVDLLVSRGCGLSVVDDEGYNILHVACLGDSVEVVDFLITHKLFDIERRGKYGWTPVMIAANMGQKKVFDLLVSRGCDMSVVDDEGDNILHVACMGDNVEVVDFLITHKLFDIERRGKYGRTPVMFAASKGQKKVFDLLVSRGSELSVVDDEGENILHVAAMGGNVSIVRYILTKLPVDINSRTKKGTTPLKIAKQYKYEAVVKLLLERGAVDT